MNWTIKIISKTLITNISYISWGGYNKEFYGNTNFKLYNSYRLRLRSKESRSKLHRHLKCWIRIIKVYKRVSILKIEIRNSWYNFNKLIIKMDGLSALVWSKKTFSELELNWEGSSSSRGWIFFLNQISTSNPTCFFSSWWTSAISIYIFNIFY